PQARPIVAMGQFVQHRGKQFPVAGAVGASGALLTGAAIDQARQQRLVEQQAIADQAAMHGVGQTGPAHPDPLVQALEEGGWQQGVGSVEQLLADLSLSGIQPALVQLQAQLGMRAGGQREKQGQQPEPEAKQRMGHGTWTAASGCAGGKHAPPVDGASDRLASQDGFGQLQVGGLQGRSLGTDQLQCGFQLGATDLAGAGDEAGGILAGGQDDLVVAGSQVGGGFGGADQGTADHVGGSDEAGGAGQGRQAQQGRSAEQANQGHGFFLWLLADRSSSVNEPGNTEPCAG